MSEISILIVLAILYVISSIYLNCHLTAKLNTARNRNNLLERDIWMLKVYYQGVKPLGLDEEE